MANGVDRHKSNQTSYFVGTSVVSFMVCGNEMLSIVTKLQLIKMSNRVLTVFLTRGQLQAVVFSSDNKFMFFPQSFFATVFISVLFLVYLFEHFALQCRLLILLIYFLWRHSLCLRPNCIERSCHILLCTISHILRPFGSVCILSTSVQFTCIYIYC